MPETDARPHPRRPRARQSRRPLPADPWWVYAPHLRALLEHRGLSDQAAADMSGVAYLNVNVWTRGLRRPDPALLERLLKGIGASRGDLLRVIQDPPHPTGLPLATVDAVRAERGQGYGVGESAERHGATPAQVVEIIDGGGRGRISAPGKNPKKSGSRG